MTNARFRTALLGSGAAVALMATAVPASADEINDLQAQIEQLQAQINKIEQSQDVVEQQYIAAPANAVVGGDKPGTFRLPGSNTSVNIGGYAKLDLIYDINEDNGDSFGFTGIALYNPAPSAKDLDNNFRLHAKQSRLWVKTWTPTDWGEFATHIEADFEGGDGNQLVSNSDHFRLRHAYGRLGNLLAGQTWSNFNTPWQWPATIDFNGTIGTSFIRQAQIRYTAPLGNGLSLAVSLENPESSGICLGGVLTCTTTSAQFAESTGGLGTDPIPDVVARLEYGADWGTVAIAGVGRYMRFHDSTTPTVDDEEFGWGINVAAVLKLLSTTSVGFQGMYGHGMGRYALWGVGAAAVKNPFTGFGDTNEFIGGNAWIQHSWTDNLFSVAAVGWGFIDWDVNLAGRNKNVYSGHVNLQWQPVSRANIGIEYSIGHRETNLNADGTAQRVQVGFQWGFST